MTTSDYLILATKNRCLATHNNGKDLNKMTYTAKDPHPPTHFQYLRETKSWGWEGGEEEDREGEKVSLKTLSTTRGVG